VESFTFKEPLFDVGFVPHGQGHLATIEGKALAAFVASAEGSEETFVEKEFLSNELGEVWLMGYFGLEFTESLLFASAASESDVRSVGSTLGEEPAKPRSCGDTFLEQKKFGRDPDAGKEYSGAIEEAQPLKPYRGRPNIAVSRGNLIY
jgi:hypothetical protein